MKSLFCHLEKLRKFMDLSPQAKIIWEKIPSNIRVKLLNNVYCSFCRKAVGIGCVKGRVEKGDVILKGICTNCAGPVCRLIETSET